MYYFFVKISVICCQFVVRSENEIPFGHPEFKGNDDLIDNNEITKYNNLRSIDLMLTGVNGDVVNSTTSNSRITFKLTSLSDGELITKYNNVETKITFKFIKSDSLIRFDYDNIMVGDDLIIKVTLLDDIQGNLTICVSNQSQFKVVDSNTLIYF